MLISEAFDLYIREEIAANGGSINTCEGYKYAMRAFITEWGNIDVEEITPLSVKQFTFNFQFNVKDREHSAGTTRDYLACLRSVLRMCRERGVQTLSPDAIKLPKREKKIPLCLEEHEIEQLIQAASRSCRGYPAINRFRNVLIIKMLYATGLRISELCRLDINDIHNREFVVVGKSRDPRVCYITEEIEEMITQYLSMRTDNNAALFVSAQTGGKRLSPKTVQMMFRRIRRQLSVGKATPHTMRHSFCTKLLECGVDIRHTAKLMGHQNWDTTRIYTHIKDRQLKDVYDAVMR